MTVTMRFAALRSEPTLIRKRIRRPGRPHRDNGEAELAALLGPEWRYERWQYPLQLCHPFTPDFWLPASEDGDELHIELTWLDWAIDRAETRIANTGGSSRRARTRREELATEHRLLVERWDRKRLKVDETNRLYGPIYGLHVSLVTYQLSQTFVSGATALPDLLAA